MLALVNYAGVAQDSNSTTLVPAIISFGDSSLDVGNNDYLSRTVFKSNYPPYGRDFEDQKPTGRFCNGKLVGDITGNEDLRLFVHLSHMHAVFVD